MTQLVFMMLRLSLTTSEPNSLLVRLDSTELLISMQTGKWSENLSLGNLTISILPSMALEW